MNGGQISSRKLPPIRFSFHPRREPCAREGRGLRRATAVNYQLNPVSKIDKPVVQLTGHCVAERLFGCLPVPTLPLLISIVSGAIGFTIAFSVHYTPIPLAIAILVLLLTLRRRSGTPGNRLLPP